MQKTLAELADLVQGELCGDPSMIITGVASIPCAGAQDITFAESEQYLGRLSSCQAAASIVLGRIGVAVVFVSCHCNVGLHFVGHGYWPACVFGVT